MTTIQDCSKFLEDTLLRATARLKDSFISDDKLRTKLAHIVGCPSNRAGARFLLASTLAKQDNPKLDIRKPFIEVYTGAAKNNAYSGRGYDEHYVGRFIRKHRLPCSSTTAFLTPGFRTKNVVLTTDQRLRGRPAEMYVYILEIFGRHSQGQGFGPRCVV